MATKLVVTFQTKLRSKHAEQLIVDDNMRFVDFVDFCAERINVKHIHIIGIRPANAREQRVVPHLLDS